jgi:dihydroxyacid dehydratase/phosphogluconate dehydratase
MFEPSDLPDDVRAAGGEPVPLLLPPAGPLSGVALAREWTADTIGFSCAAENLDALLLTAESPEGLFGMLLAAIRLDIPAVCLPPPGTPLAAAVTALGIAPTSGDPSGAVVGVGANGGPRPGDLVENFSLANALRAGVAAGGGPEVLVHLAAVAREARVQGFSQMARVLAPETPAANPGWTKNNGVRALLASQGDDLHDIRTVDGHLRRNLPSAASTPPEHHRLVLAQARVSGAEAVCRFPADSAEPAGECRVYGSEDAAVRAVRSGAASDGAVLVVNGCGPRGSGLRRLEVLNAALREMGLRTPVVTDGLPPEDARGTWASLFAPEAFSGGVIGRLRDGDPLRLDLQGGRIRAGIRAGELEAREPFKPPGRTGFGYAARHARSALPALEGAGFG